MKTVRHLFPSKDGYTGAYAHLGCCSNCGVLGMVEEVDPAYPCRSCKGYIVDGIYGQWTKMDGSKAAEGGYWQLTEQSLFVIASFI